MHPVRLEITTLLQTLVKRVKKFELTEPVQSGKNSTIHALANVLVKVH